MSNEVEVKEVKVLNAISESESYTLGDDENVEFLSEEMITGGKARNIVTVQVKTAMGMKFKVSVVKRNPLYEILNSDNKRELLNTKDAQDDIVRTSELSIEVNNETLVECIVSPKLNIKEGRLHIGDKALPFDTIDLLVGAYNEVNSPKRTEAAVEQFQKEDEK